MKRTALYIALITFLALTACRDKFTEIFTGNSPIYMTYEDLRLAVRQTTPSDLSNPGKIYFKDDYIFIVEEMKGIHVINNSNPSNPVNTTFIEIPGNVDIAIKGNILYADSYIDVVALDVSDLTDIREVSRVKDVLPYSIPAYDENYPLADIDEEKGVVTGWEIKKVTQELKNNYYPVYGYEDVWNDASTRGDITGGISGNGIGVGGSMARFGITENTLYAVDKVSIHVFSIADPDSLVLRREFNVGWNIETLFILGETLFLGSQSGVSIYDISVPTSPMYISNFWHLTGCDPVVVQDDLAFITLRGGNLCGNNVNQLVVLSVRNLREPVELKTYPMEGPYGLGIDGKTLFVCDGEAGLKIYDVTDPLTINKHRIAQFPEILAYDAIPIDGVLMLIGDDGLYQYDYQDLTNIVLLSIIEVK